MKRASIALAILAATLAAHNATAQQSDWLVRARAVHISPDNGADPISNVGAADRVTVSSKTIPEVDFVYFYTPNLAAELVLTYPQKHDVALDGKNIGSFKHLPPTLLAQYHFMPGQQFRPYLGAGVNYTRISSVNLLGGAGSLEHSSVGLALQAGLDVAIDKNWSVNLDVKKVQIRSDLAISGTRVSELKIDPVLVGIGLGYRF
ncbi:MAG: OmpW family outer membrane protein [Pseudomonadota bacterium]